MKYLALILLLSSCVTITHGETYEKVFKDHADEVRQCYRTRLAKTPNLQGTLILELAIENAGEVQTAHFGDASTIKDEQLRQCLHDRAMKWIFPAPREEQILMMSYPYDFSTAAGGVVKLGHATQTN